MKMVRSDLAASGVIFTLDTETGFRDVGVHHRRLRPRRERGAGHGRSGRVLRLQADLPAGPSRRAAPHARRKKIKMVYAEGAHARADAQRADRRRTSARASASTDDDVLTLADYAITIEDHYSAQGRPAHADGHRVGQGRHRRRALHRAGAARDGRLAAARRRCSRTTRSTGQGKVLATGRAVGEPMRRRHGPGRHRRPPARRVPARRGAGRRHDDARLGAGDEDRGRGRHQPRRPHLPCRDRRARARHPGRGRRGRRDARAARPAQTVTVSCAEGDVGQVYEGAVPFEVADAPISQHSPRPRPSIMVNLGNPELRLPDQLPAERRRRPGAHGVHRHRAHQGPSDGAAASRAGRRRERARARSLG